MCCFATFYALMGDKTVGIRSLDILKNVSMKYMYFALGMSILLFFNNHEL